MERRQRLVFLGCCLLLLLVVGVLVTGSLKFVFGDFWFVSGLLLLILLSVVDQPFFTRDANVFMNGVAGVISLASVQSADRSFLWFVFLGWSAYLVSSSYLVMLKRTRALPEESPWIMFISRLNRQLGRPESLFSAFFLWGVWVQFTPDSSAYRVLLLYWAAFIILNLPVVSRSIATLLSRSREREPDVAVGYVTAFHSPRVLECKLSHDAPELAPGSLVGIKLDDGTELARGRLIQDRLLDGARAARIAVSEPSDAWRHVARPREGRGPVRIVLTSPADGATAQPAGVVSAGSDIGTLRFIADADADLVEGEVVAVDLPSIRAYYQIFAATLRDTSLSDGQFIQEVEVLASQLGFWKEKRCRFEPISWVPPAGGIVLRLTDGLGQTHEVPGGHLEVGGVPNSQFPVHLCLEDAVTHNTAILGVTGSGKSYLAFWTIMGLVEHGVRVLILDVTRQHWVFLNRLSPTPIKKLDDVKTWLDSDSKIAVHQFAQSASYPTTTADIAARVLGYMKEKITLRAGENEPARLCIVFEEAHSLIPEWNQVAREGDKQEVNRTARTVLQGRKYGIGCLVISQRTANVTKTILNQCNTIIALQSFDQTGLDFLGNYMGSAYANVICTLPPRHAVLVGKASSSTRPVLFGIRDLGDQWPAKTEESAPPATGSPEEGERSGDETAEKP